MIPDSEEMISFRSLAANIRPRVDKETVRQWAMFGRKSSITGAMVFLEYTQQGARYYTSMAAYRRFMLRINGQPVEEKVNRK